MKDKIILLLSNNDNYHDHKEKMAWTASTLYFAFSVAIISWLLTFDPTKITISLLQIKVLGIILFSILFVSIISFVWMQFDMRWKSADISTILRKLIFNFKKKKLPIVYSNDFNSNTNNNKVYFPPKIQNELEKLNKERTACNLFCAFIQIVFIFGLFNTKLDNRYRTEIPSYIGIITFFVIKILILSFL